MAQEKKEPETKELEQARDTLVSMGVGEISPEMASHIALDPKENKKTRELAIESLHFDLVSAEMTGAEPPSVAKDTIQKIAFDRKEQAGLRFHALRQGVFNENREQIARSIAEDKTEDPSLRISLLQRQPKDDRSPQGSSPLYPLTSTSLREVAEKIANDRSENENVIGHLLSEDSLLSPKTLKDASDFYKQKNTHLADRAINNTAHPDFPKGLVHAAKMFDDYENEVKPSHFAAVKSAFSGNKENVSHRGIVAGSNKHQDAVPHIKEYAKKVQQEVLAEAKVVDSDVHDPKPEADVPVVKHIDGQPHILAFRGVAGEYAKQIKDALDINEGLRPAKANAKIVPSQIFHSWTTNPKTAAMFAARSDTPGGQGHGVVLKAWLPAKHLLHSSFHDAFPAQRNVRTSKAEENELIFLHPNEEMKIDHDNIHSIQEGNTEHFSPLKSIQEPKQPEAAPAMPKAPEMKMAKAEADDTAPAHDEIDRLLRHPDPVERRLALKLYNVNANHIISALKHHKDPELRQALIFHRSSDDSVLSHVIQNPISNDELKQTTNHPYFFEHGHAANLVESTCNPLGPCDKDRLQTVCDIVCGQQTLLDPSLLVNLVRAAHKHMPDRVHHVLFHASANGKVFDTYFDEALNDPNGSNPIPDLQAQFIADPRVCPEVVGRAFDLDPGHPLRMHALSSPHAPRPHIDNAMIGLFVYPNDPRGPYVAKNPTLTSGDLDRLLSCANETIQDIAMQHPSLDESHAKKVQSIKEGRAFNQQSVQKSEDNLTFKQDHADSEILRHMHGFRPHLDRVFEAARFMVGAPVASMDTIRRALWKADGDPEAAAFFAYNLEDTERNRRAIKAIMELQDCEKAESEQEIKGQVLAVHPNSQNQANEIERAFQSGQVVPVRLNGKHSQGSMVAQDPNSHTSYLLKPGSGAQSPAAGAREDPSSQAQREAAFWAIANMWGLGDSVPRCDLLFIDGQQFACISLLDENFRSVQVTRKENPGFVKSVFDSYRNEGLLHKWAIIDYILGNPDRHADNLMVNKDGKVVLIDHGSAFCGASFDPGFDQNSFVPAYLRHRAPSTLNFSTAPVEEKMRYMEPAPADKKEELSQWVMGLNADSLRNTLTTYYIDPAACIERLHELQTLVAQGEPVDEAINRLWVGT